jgi:hypothetical protein
MYDMLQYLSIYYLLLISQGGASQPPRDTDNIYLVMVSSIFMKSFIVISSTDIQHHNTPEAKQGNVLGRAGSATRST